MARLLNDALPADIWQARRRNQVAGVGSEDPFAPAQGPNDAMTGPQWQAARAAQLQGKPVALRALGLSEDALSGRRMLDLLARGEGTADAGVGGYDVTYGFGRYWPKGAGKPTDMTLGQIKAAQRGMRTGGNQSTPVGHPHSDWARRRRPAITSEQFQAEIGSLAQPASAARAR